MRKAPFRPDHEISQTYNSGVCALFRQQDTARPGYKPRPELERKALLHYEEQRMGLNRYYAARQVDVAAERVIRVPRGPASCVPTPQDIVRTENGVFYRVDLVQTVPGIWPESLDLTLVRYTWDASSVTADAVPPDPTPSVASRHLPLTGGVGPEGEGFSPAGGTKGA